MRVYSRAAVVCVCLSAVMAGCGVLPAREKAQSLGPPIYDQPEVRVVGGQQALQSDAPAVEISVGVSAIGDADLLAFAICHIGKVAEKHDFAFSRVPGPPQIRTLNPEVGAVEAQLRAILYRSLHGVSQREQVVATELRLVKCDEI